MSDFGSLISSTSNSASTVAGSVPLESGSHSRSRPIGTHRGPLSHPAILLLIAVAMLFAASALGYIPQFNSSLEAAFRSGESRALPVLSPAFYGIAGLLTFLFLLALMRSFNLLLRRARETSQFARRRVEPLAQFLEETAACKISVRVARETYDLLQPHYPNLMCIGLADTLRHDLGLEDEQIRVLDAKLFTRCDRRDCPSEAAAVDLTRLVTVFDLLSRIEAAAPLRSERPFGVRDRATDTPPHPPVKDLSVEQSPVNDLPLQKSRNSTSAQRKALHAAALQAIESRSLRIAETSAQRRRSSDYEGPRRRVTDNPSISPAYEGPYRRYADHAIARPGASSERKAELDPAELNRLDPLFASPRNTRTIEPTRR